MPAPIIRGEGQQGHNDRDRDKNPTTSPGTYDPPYTPGPTPGSSPTYNSPPSYVTPPSYYDAPSTPVSPFQFEQKQEKKRQQKEKKDRQDGLAILQALLRGDTLKKSKDPYGVTRDEKPTGNPWEEIVSPKVPSDERLGKLADKGERRDNLTEFLNQINKTPKAAPGSELALPERLKYRKNGQLKREWDQDFINASLGDYQESWQRDKFLNDMMEMQFQDREDWLLGRNYRKSQDIIKVLKDAGQAAYEGDYDYLANYMQEHPNFKLDVPGYRQQFGITPEGILNQWDEQKDSLNPQDRSNMRAYTIDPMVDHYETLRRSYGKANKYVRQAIERYETKYNESVEFGEKSPDAVRSQAAEKAGDAIPDLTPPTSKEDQQIFDRVGNADDPGTADWSSLLTAPLGKKGRKTGKASNQQTVSEARDVAKAQLGLDKLPSVRQMLAVKVSEGNLDPNDDASVEQWIHRFQNPNHPDTRAMYVGWAMQQNPELDTDAGLAFINEPIQAYAQEALARREANAEYDAEHAEELAEADRTSHDGFWDTVGDVGSASSRGIGDMSRGLASPFVGIKNALSGDSDVTGYENFQDDEGVGALGWTFDKLARLSYGVAGFANAWYGLDDEPTQPWHGQNGFLANAASVATDPLSLLTGKSWLDSVDEIVSDPGKFADPFNAAYDQVFRGSNLPGIEDDIVPTTFSQVIANNAARDGEHDIYDQEWFQHTAGFALDVGLDPLNLVGVGLVDDTLKLPTRVVKGLKATDDGKEITTAANVIKGLSDPRSSGVAEHVFRINEGIKRLGDDLDGIEYVTDQELFPVDIGVQYRQFVDDGVGTVPDYGLEYADTSAVRAEINSQMKALRIQEAKVINDSGIQHLTDEASNIHDELGLLVFDKPADLRVQKLMARTSIPIKVSQDLGLKLENKGGAFWRHYLKPMDEGARLQGFSDIKYVEGAKGTAAQKAAQQLDELDAAIGAGKLSGPAVEKQRAYLQGVVNEGSEVKAATQRYLDAGTPGLAPSRFDPTKEFANAMGISKDQFLTIFRERDVHDALTRGPELLVQSDPVARKMLKQANRRIADSKAQLRAPGISYEKAKAAAKALEIGYTQSSNITLSGALRYLDVVLKNRNGAKAAFSDPILAQQLDVLKGKIDETLESSEFYDDLDDESIGDYIGGFVGERDPLTDKPTNRLPSLNGQYEDFDFFGKSLADVLEHTPEAFKSKGAQLRAAKAEIEAQIENLRLHHSDEITGLPPAQAYKVEQLLPVDSSFRKADGSVDVDKVRDAIKFDPHNHTHSYVKPSTPEETAFLDIVKDTIHYEYMGAYRAEKSVIWKAKRGAAPAKSTKHVDELGPRPTAESFREGGISKAIRKGDKRPKTQTVREWFELTPQQGVKPPKIKLTPDERRFIRIESDIRDGNKLSNSDKKFLARFVWGDETRKVKDYGVKDFEKEVLEATKDTHPDLHLISRAIKPSSKNFEKWTYHAEEIEGGYRTKAQLEWERVLEQRKRRWDKARAEAEELDAKADRAVDTKFKLSKEEKELAAQKANKKAVDGTLKSISEAGEIKQVPTNTRLTINEQARETLRRADLEIKYEQTQLKIAELEAKNADELKAIKAKQSALNTKRRKLYKKVEVARQQAIATKQVMKRRFGEEHIMQLGDAPVRMTGRMVQVRLLGMRKNLQFTNSLFRGAEQAHMLLPSTTYAKFANTFVRPTKQLTTREAIYFRAVWESKTPVIIKAHLSRLSERMRDIPETERFLMMQAVREGHIYDGPHANLFQGVKDELDEVLSIWNGTDEFYWFRDLGKAGHDPLHPYEITKFLPREYTPNMRVVHRSMSMAGREEIILDDLIEGIKANGHPNPKDLTDPFRFSWVMRLAADQARQQRALHHMMRQTFGVEIPSVNFKESSIKAIELKAEKRKIIEKLRDNYGWETVPELGDNHLFPPEAVADIKKLLEIMKPGDAANKISKLFDGAVGYWKQGMTIYNPGYYTRNGIGEIMASWLDGVNHPKWYRMAYRVHRYSKAADHNLADLVKKWSVLDGKIPVDEAKASEVLFKLKGGQAVRIEDAYREYINMGLKSTFANTDLERGVRSLGASGLTDSRTLKTLKKFNERVHDFGEGFEDYLRMSHFLHAMQHSGRGNIADAALYAAERVRKYHFDYTDFSNFEKSVMLRAFPFYKWTRRGAPLMFAHLFMTPGKMLALPKAMDTASGLGFDPMGAFTDDPLFSTQDVHDDKNGYLPDYQGIAPAWVKDLFAYQMQPAEDDEYANYFRVQTPMIDGLNTMMSLTPGSGNGPLDYFGDSAGYPLFNPLFKMPIELARNRSMDPDFPYEIAGGEYNEMNGINPVEALTSYVARNANPLTGFLAKLSKNGDLGPLSMGDGSYRDSVGYNANRDITSFATGLGFYQGRPDNTLHLNPGAPLPDPAVGTYELSEIPMFRGATAAGEQGSQPKPQDAAELIKGLIEGTNDSDGGSGWIDYGNSGWRNFGSGWRNFGYGGGYSSSGVSSSSGSMEFWALLQQLKEMIDQGKVIDD